MLQQATENKNVGAKQKGCGGPMSNKHGASSQLLLLLCQQQWCLCWHKQRSSLPCLLDIALPPLEASTDAGGRTGLSAALCTCKSHARAMQGPCKAHATPHARYVQGPCKARARLAAAQVTAASFSCC